ncbi:hypothetical protein FPV67DRAFT_1459162 [Lyophyllum atratum]|nr:hypothetical protein FPV67DRAFT_1459162 [Lyophyllum atratum]
MPTRNAKGKMRAVAQDEGPGRTDAYVIALMSGSDDRFGGIVKFRTALRAAYYKHRTNACCDDGGDSIGLQASASNSSTPPPFLGAAPATSCPTSRLVASHRLAPWSSLGQLGTFVVTTGSQNHGISGHAPSAPPPTVPAPPRAQTPAAAPLPPSACTFGPIRASLPASDRSPSYVLHHQDFCGYGTPCPPLQHPPLLANPVAAVRGSCDPERILDAGNGQTSSRGLTVIATGKRRNSLKDIGNDGIDNEVLACAPNSRVWSLIFVPFNN